MADEAPRVYVPSKKHKYPKGSGSICPRGLTVSDAQRMLDGAVSVPGVPDAPSDALWAVDGSWCFCAMPTHPHRLGDHTWHGHPRIGGEVPYGVLRRLADAGHLTRRQLKALTRQRELPPEWPA